MPGCPVSPSLISTCCCAYRDPEKLTLVRRRHAGVEVTAEFRELPEDPRVDAVAIVTAVLHYQVALAALKAGKHVLVDKPLIRISVQSRHLDRVMFINDSSHARRPTAANLLRPDGWRPEPTRVCRRASIGLHATIWGAMIRGRRGRHQGCRAGRRRHRRPGPHCRALIRWMD
jgi:hypothetical protein